MAIDPRSGDRMRRLHGDRTVSGFDLTFCAPKSVSLLHLLAPGEIAGEAGAGHRAAVEEAVGYLARAAHGVRRRRQGAVGGGPLHRSGGRATSSTGPAERSTPTSTPTLVVANVAQGVDGPWSSIDSRRLFAHAPAVQAVYHARLRLELTTRLGAAWDVPATGLGDVVGVDPRLRRLFSTRSASMDRVRPRPHRPGGGVPGRSRGGFHATRPEKDRSPTVDSLSGRVAETGGPTSASTWAT